MKFPRMIAVLGLTCALLLSGCGLPERRNQQPFRIDGIQEKRNTTVAAYKNA